jgi:hypothetical protein
LRAELEDDATMTGSINSGDNGALRTIIAGLFLFLSLAAAGIWFARTRRSPASRAVATVLLALAATGAAATIALANAAPPQWARYLHAGTLPRAIKPNEALTGFVRVEVVDHGDNVRLIMPEATEEAR